MRLKQIEIRMTLNDATKLIDSYAAAMDARYRQPVFDEWAIVSIVDSRAYLLAYHGPREKQFRQNFRGDAGSMLNCLLSRRESPGDFEFFHDGVGTRFESYTVLGAGVYLLWNNTAQSIQDITRNPLWFAVQRPYLELTDHFRADPMIRPQLSMPCERVG